jgi:hypothetical protein
MTATGQTFMHYAGTSRVLRIPLVYADGENFDEVVTAADWICAPSPDAAEAAFFIRKSLGSGVSISAGPGKRFVQVSLRPADTLFREGGLQLGNHYHEARISWGDGDQALLLTGTMQLRKRIGARATDT